MYRVGPVAITFHAVYTQMNAYYNYITVTVLWRDLHIIRTVVRIVGMGRMSHICNTKCSRLYSCS